MMKFIRYKLSQYAVVALSCGLMIYSCKSSKTVVATSLCNIDHRNIQFKTDSITGFDVASYLYSGYKDNYNFLIDSLKLYSSDTVGFLIRPCFIHRGICFKKQDLYYYDFSKKENRVIKIPNSCNIIENYFLFLTKSTDKIEMKSDTVLTVPDCPVDFLFKINSSFLYSSIKGNAIDMYKRNSFNLKELLQQCDSLMNKYK